jgi:hypothetical protein
MAGNSGHDDFVEALDSVKNAIGKWHDWEELVAIVKKVLSHGNCNLIRELKAISDKKYARQGGEHAKKVSPYGSS